MVELDGILLSLLAFPLMDYEFSLEVRHKFHVFLLLVSPHDFQFVVEQEFEFLLEGERESQPSHVGSFASLPEVDDAVEVVGVARLFDTVTLVVYGHPVTAQEYVTVHGVKVTC
jgi:hypothetical protein